VFVIFDLDVLSRVATNLGRTRAIAHYGWLKRYGKGLPAINLFDYVCRSGNWTRTETKSIERTPRMFCCLWVLMRISRFWPYQKLCAREWIWTRKRAINSCLERLTATRAQRIGFFSRRNVKKVLFFLPHVRNIHFESDKNNVLHSVYVFEIQRIRNFSYENNFFENFILYIFERTPFILMQIIYKEHYSFVRKSLLPFNNIAYISSMTSRRYLYNKLTVLTMLTIDNNLWNQHDKTNLTCIVYTNKNRGRNSTCLL